MTFACATFPVFGPALTIHNFSLYRRTRSDVSRFRGLCFCHFLWLRLLSVSFNRDASGLQCKGKRAESCRGKGHRCVCRENKPPLAFYQWAQASRVACGGRGSSFEAPRWQGLRLSVIFLGIVGRHGCTCTIQKVACLFTPVSCQCAKSGAHLRRRNSFVLGRLCAAHVALKQGSSTTRHSWRFSQHSLRSYPGSQRLGVLWLCLFSCQQWFIHVFARLQMSIPVSFFFLGRQTGESNILGYLQNSPWRDVFACRASYWWSVWGRSAGTSHRFWWSSECISSHGHSPMASALFLSETFVSSRSRHDVKNCAGGSSLRGPGPGPSLCCLTGTCPGPWLEQAWRQPRGPRWLCLGAGTKGITRWERRLCQQQGPPEPHEWCRGCLGKILEPLPIKRCMGTKIGMVKIFSNFQKLWQNRWWADGTRVGSFPRIQYVAAQWSQKFTVQIRWDTRKFHRKNLYLCRCADISL